MSQREHYEIKRAPRRSWGLTLALILLTITVAVFGWIWWQARQPSPPYGSSASSAGGLTGPDEVAPPAAMPSVALPASAAPPASASSAAASPQYPIEPAAQAGQPAPKASPAQADATVRPELKALVGSKSIAEFLQVEGFVRRFVATIDNLTRGHAPGATWPMQPAGGRFAVTGEGDARTIDPANSARYTPFVHFAEAVDSAKAAALYRKHYPLFQQAFEDLGYPGSYFNDRLVGVIDHLLQAPEPPSPPKLTQTEIKGPFASEKPRTRYEYADPQLEALSSGQKMMVRMGLENERRVKEKLREVRAAVVGR